MITLPKLSNKQKEIITFVIRYRFLNRIHIQNFINHKDYSTLNKYLKYLTKNQYLNRIYSQKFGENIKPSVYYLGINGIHYLKTLDNINPNQFRKLYHESKRKDSFRQHCLALADFVCNLNAHAKQQDKNVTLLTRNDFLALRDTPLSQFLQIPNPDLYYSFSGTGIAKRCFVVVIDEYLPSFILRSKARKFFRAYQDENWEELFDNKFPSIAYLLPTEKKLKTMKRAITMVRNEFDDESINKNVKCNLTLISEIQLKSIADKIWRKA